MQQRKIVQAVLACFLMIPLFFFAVVPAHAGSHAHTQVSLPGSLPPEQCLVVAVQSRVTGSQSFQAIVQATNSCGAAFTVTTRLNTQQTTCPPFATTSTPISVQLRDRQTAVITQEYQAGCVVCEDQVPVTFPPFGVRVTAFAFGTVPLRGTFFQATSNTAAAVPDLRLTNTPHPYVPPCP